MEFPKEIDQIWLFGSQARKTSGFGSDTDVLVVADDCEVDTLKEILQRQFGGHVDLAHYTYEGIEKIVSTSSLFAMHLRDEGVPIYKASDRLSSMLAGMQDYQSYLKDLELLRKLLNEVLLSLRLGTTSLIFEAGVLGTVARNGGIIMTYHLGRPDYSTSSPFTLGQLEPRLALPVSTDCYNFLQNCRRAGERGQEVVEPSANKRELRVIATRLDSWLKNCIRYVEEG